MLCKMINLHGTHSISYGVSYAIAHFKVSACFSCQVTVLIFYFFGFRFCVCEIKKPLNSF
jgi:hypothetical protein